MPTANQQRITEYCRQHTERYAKWYSDLYTKSFDKTASCKEILPVLRKDVRMLRRDAAGIVGQDIARFLYCFERHLLAEDCVRMNPMKASLVLSGVKLIFHALCDIARNGQASSNIRQQARESSSLIRQHAGRSPIPKTNSTGALKFCMPKY